MDFLVVFLEQKQESVQRRCQPLHHFRDLQQLQQLVYFIWRNNVTLSGLRVGRQHERVQRLEHLPLLRRHSLFRGGYCYSPMS